MSEVKIGLSIVNVYGRLWGQKYPDLYAQHSVRSCAKKTPWKPPCTFSMRYPFLMILSFPPKKKLLCLKDISQKSGWGYPRTSFFEVFDERQTAQPWPTEAHLLVGIRCHDVLTIPGDAIGRRNVFAGETHGQEACLGKMLEPVGTAGDSRRHTFWIKNGAFRKWFEKPWVLGNHF